MYAISYVEEGKPKIVTDIKDTTELLQSLMQIISNINEEQKVYSWANKAHFGDKYENTKLHFVVRCYKKSLIDEPVRVVTLNGKIVSGEEKVFAGTKTIVNNIINSHDDAVDKRIAVKYQEDIWENSKVTVRVVAETYLDFSMSVYFLVKTNGVLLKVEIYKREKDLIEDSICLRNGVPTDIIPKQGVIKASRVMNGLVRAGYVDRSHYIV
jgi:hypothetical protein